MPRTHVDDNTWREWVDPYIVDSKRLITVCRNNLRFKQLEDLDVDLVEGKDGIQIQLAEFELDIHWREALSKYAEQHESHCTASHRQFSNEQNGTICSTVKDQP
ncbi:hypothetical protein PN419_14500 [Halorubrum ezzemoulense]|jgi:hypothetical protein|nr:MULTISPECIES: hypothetical protein [Halorubrum]MDB9234668.1 hypothetical protein [Halorubrum ezzemoulense]MDB9250196.1 hypothetical protein [Halorubrum ezzemoulense]MDB9260426.1 hypothetical protein [Halorubrum ezzemoulense]MDB9263722.1 hypothetical protein [Halorubrum ezzemoulense]MDB9267261.1 hypothetical protein [Halorubrum ezzemoulense]